MATLADRLPAGIPGPGETFAEKYLVERVIGIGGMGAVLAARHSQLEERVAIKVLLPDLLENEELVTRFVREGRAAVKIRSEHVGRVLDVGELDTGLPYIVMEYLDGRDLNEVLRGGPVAIASAATYVLEACEALAQAHVAGIVHRDVKPSNLFLTVRPDGTTCVKVLDFGISKVVASSAAGAELSVTRTASIMGSPLYMSPEQLRSFRDVDARTDIWSLGVVLFELVAGQPPFSSESMALLAASILRDDPPRLRELRPETPPAFEAAVRRCLEKDPDRRFQNVAHLAAALAPFAAEHARGGAERIARVVQGGGSSPFVADVLGAGGEVSGDASTVARTGVAWGGSTQRGRRARVIALVAGVLVAVACIVEVAFVAGKRSTEEDTGGSPAGSQPIPPPPVSASAITTTVPPASAASPEPTAPSGPEPAASVSATSTAKARPSPPPRPAGPGVPTPPRPSPPKVAPGLADDRHG
jgi:eukaryotic-like serine/threonine-protein kinase